MQIIYSNLVHHHYEHQTHITSIEKRAKITINIQLYIILPYFSMKKTFL